mmetsp:Transcript_15543/g.21062  ORF Transcript_15543/g.21062 Transcript_15543/m.21062 type:complete len:122 (-) Transcript_15543:67-432(-)
MGDKRRLLQVMINLVKNALKFTHSGSILIKVLYMASCQSLQVHVKDTGSGITADELPRLFKKFGKLHRTAAQNSNGIGLGLLISKQIVEKSGGSIAAHSDGVGSGSTFGFTMVMKESESRA